MKKIKIKKNKPNDKGRHRKGVRGLLEIKKISKFFKEKCAVDDLSIELEKGKSYGLIGANGAGKTTTFRMILGLIQANNGSILWDGEKINYHNIHKVGYLPEERGLYPKIKIKDQLHYLGKLKHMLNSDIEKEMNYWLDRFKIIEYKNKKAKELSKGNQQKIQFIYSVLHKPQLLILDEPFSGLDPINVEMLKEAVFDLKKNGTSVLFSSHRMEHIEEMCEDLCILKNGKTVAKGHINEIKKGYGNKTLIFKTEFPLEFADCLLGVEKVEKAKHEYHILLEDESYAYSILKQIISHGFIQKFEVKEPTLNQIFIEKVGDKHE